MGVPANALMLLLSCHPGVCLSVHRSKLLDTLAIVDLLRVKLLDSNHQVVLVSGHMTVT